MWRNRILAAGLFVCLVPTGTLAQQGRQRVTVEVYVPESARLFFEGQQTRSTGPKRRFVSPPLPPGKYTYTLKAVIPSRNGPRTVTRRIDVRPGDFESIDLREPGQRPIADVEYEPTPQKVVEALLRLAKVTSKDEVWDLGCGDGRIPVTAAKDYGCKAYGFDIDPQRARPGFPRQSAPAWRGAACHDRTTRHFHDRPEQRADHRHALPAAASERPLVAATPEIAAGRARPFGRAPDGRHQAGRAHRSRYGAGRIRRLSVEGGDDSRQVSFPVFSPAWFLFCSVWRLIRAKRITPSVSHHEEQGHNGAERANTRHAIGFQEEPGSCISNSLPSRPIHRATFPFTCPSCPRRFDAWFRWSGPAVRDGCRRCAARPDAPMQIETYGTDAPLVGVPLCPRRTIANYAQAEL
jgi:uncharacterized protein (TIGR03000 family)